MVKGTDHYCMEKKQETAQYTLEINPRSPSKLLGGRGSLCPRLISSVSPVEHSTRKQSGFSAVFQKFFMESRQ